MTSHAPIYLFSYGTLQTPQVQISQFGRLLAGQPDILPGYRKAMVEISDPAVIAASGERFHPILLRTGLELDEVTGTVFEITAEELAAADAYEVSDYRRIAVRLRSGLEAWVYVKA
ncbi:gamma-glutamylcyclotransferase family protein [Rhabdaerophilum sp. SD176]|uniref:gamma-glutamylcyclotransferase family protein n=1 Tax=Rhabdaerophilum sp. SD176 TaxID=2983548 RepID=UPI0024E027ED|nr:gamma-glutamylcyclotransferase family protein [Rhabdaerophilum sp. SD176]